MSKNKVYTHVSLFSGAGGLDIGLEQAGFHTVWANDFNHDACETHRLWSNATVIEGNIGKVDYDTIPDCDIASFGFPCQGFSLSGPRKIDDSRNVLYRHCVKLVEKKQPKLFLAENVKGLLTLGGGKIKDAIIADFESKGYVVSINLVNAADYHVPEDRQRILLVGIRKDTAFRENDDNKLESLSASISVPVENDDEVIGNTLGEEKLIVHAVAALYNLISDLRPNWLDNEDTSLTLDISIDGRKAQSCGGLVAMKEEGFTFGLED